MRKILIALATFMLGVSAFYALYNEENSPLNTAPVQVVNVPLPPEIPDEVDAENSRLFFDSFEEDEGYSGWLMADKFKGMKEVWTILLVRDHDYNGDFLHPEEAFSKEITWSASILTKNPDDSANDEDNFSSVSIVAEGDKLSFRTNKIRGIEYRFEGTITKPADPTEENPKILRGTLQKFVKGKKVAAFTDDFAYYEPHCFH